MKFKTERINCVDVFCRQIVVSFWKHLCAIEYNAFGQQISTGNKERLLEDISARMLYIINR